MDNRATRFFRDFKVVKYAKQFLLASLALAVIAAAVIAFFGFNLSYQYRGGYRITVQIEDNRPAGAVLADYKTSVTDTVEGLKDADGEEYGLEIVSVRAESLDIVGIKRTNLILTAKLLEDEDRRHLPRGEEFSVDLKNALDANGYKTEQGVAVGVDIVGVDYNAPVSFADAFFNPFAYVLLAGALICVYFVFRYNLKEAVITAYILFSDAIIFLALMAIARVPVGPAVIALLGLTMMQSVFGLAVLFGRIKGNRGTAGYTGFSDAALAGAAYRESFKKLLLIAGVSAVAALALLIGTADSMVFGVSAFIAVLCGAANAIFVAPALYGLFKEDRKPMKAKATASGAAKGAAQEQPKTRYIEPIKREPEAQAPSAGGEEAQEEDEAAGDEDETLDEGEGVDENEE